MTPVYTSSPVIGGAAAMYVDLVSLNIVVPTFDTAPFPVFSIDPSAGTQTEISAAGKEVTAAAATSTQNYVAYDYVLNDENKSKLATMVSSTGATTDILPLTLNSAPTRVSALAYCSGTLYGFTYDDGGDVFTVDPATAVLTLVTNSDIDDTIFAADCNAEGTLFATDSTNLLKSSSATTALSLVAPLSGPGFADFLETMTVAATGSAPLPDTGISVETAGIAALIAAALTAAGIVLVTRRRARA